MKSELKSDEELAQRFEEILDPEHGLRLIYMSATGCTYDEAVAAFTKAKKESVLKLAVEAVTAKQGRERAERCTCTPYRFPEMERQSLKGGYGDHHETSCRNYLR